jgi:Uma2 family endonuclease
MSVYDQLRDWARGRSPEPSLRIAPLDVQFAANRILQPDVFVFAAPLERPVPTPIRRIPDICVEVVSTRHAYDRIAKRQIYAEAGVKELWTVIEGPRLVERWTGSALATREQCHERLRTPVLPGFELDVSKLFAG